MAAAVVDRKGGPRTAVAGQRSVDAPSPSPHHRVQRARPRLPRVGKWITKTPMSQNLGTEPSSALRRLFSRGGIAILLLLCTVGWLAKELYDAKKLIKAVKSERICAWQEHMHDMMMLANSANARGDFIYADFAEEVLRTHVPQFSKRFAKPGVKTCWDHWLGELYFKRNKPLPPVVVQFRNEVRKNFASAMPGNPVDNHTESSAEQWTE